MKQRDYKLDIIRVIACLMVILMHSPRPNGGQNSYEAVGISMFTEPCIGLFFMLSGALLLPVKLSYKDFLKRRLARVLWPTLIFTMFYLAVSYCYGEITLNEWVRRVLSIPFYPEGHGILWFMYTLIGMYIVSPIISPFLVNASKKEIQFILSLWLITMCWQIFELWFDVKKDYGSIFYPFAGYGGYFLLGYYLRKYPLHIKWYLFPILFSIPFITLFVSKKMGWNLGLESFFWYLSIFSVMLCVVWWQFIVQYVNTDKIPQRVKTYIIDFSNCSFGIYLMHVFIMRRWLWNIELLNNISSYLQILIIFLLTTLSSWFLAHIISKTPIGGYIIGYNKN